MGEKIAIVACSNAGLDYMTDHKFDTYRSKIMMEGKEYIDNVTITAKEFYSELRKNPEMIPSTAQASTGEMVEIFEKLAAQGYTDIITIPISSKMSGTFQNTVLAGSMVEDKVKVHSIDSKTTTYAQGYYALVAYRMAEAGKSVEEIKAEINRLIEGTEVYFAVDTVDYLIKNGRLSRTKGFFANIMKIKPLLHIDDEGQIYSFEKIKTSRKCHERLVELIKEQTAGKDVEVFIAHADATEYLPFFQEELKALNPKVVYLSPVIGCHTGPNAIGVGYIVKSKY